MQGIQVCFPVPVMQPDAVLILFTAPGALVGQEKVFQRRDPAIYITYPLHLALLLKVVFAFATNAFVFETFFAQWQGPRQKKNCNELGTACHIRIHVVVIRIVELETGIGRLRMSRDLKSL